MRIPTKIYEALPTIYFAVGTALIGGSFYIGIDQGAMLAYFTLGWMCIGAGTVVSAMRQMARSRQ